MEGFVETTGDQPESFRMNVSLKVVAKLGFFVLLALTSAAFAADGALTEAPDLLDAESAFQVTAKMKDARTIELNYTIADGYYMYRKRFKFDADSGSAELKKAITPKGSVKEDATFGRVETYRRRVRVLLPIATDKKNQKNAGISASSRLITISAISQGCADVGVCYPPLTHHLTIDPASRESVAPDRPNDLVGKPLESAINQPWQPQQTRQPPASVVKPTSAVTDLIRKNP